MIKIMVSVYDEKSELFGNAIFTPTAGVAIRSFTDEINRKDERNEMHKHPEDYSLYQVGTFNDNTAEFTTAVPPKLLLRGDVAKEVISS